MSFKSVLNAVGGDVKKAFAWLGSPKGQAIVTAGEGLVEDVFPAATGAINLMNSWATELYKSEALATAAGEQAGSGAQKAAMVLAAVTPQALAYAQANGLSAPTAAELALANQGLVQFFNAFNGQVTGKAVAAPAPAPQPTPTA